MLSKRQRQGKRGNILLAMPPARASMAFEFHPAKFEDGYRQPASLRRAPAVWLTNRKWSVVLRSEVALRWSDIYSESQLPAANNEHLGPLHA
jgi:hypothetical protein